MMVARRYLVTGATPDACKVDIPLLCAQMQTLTAVTRYIFVFLFLFPLFGRDPPVSSSSSSTFSFDPFVFCPHWPLTRICTLTSFNSNAEAELFQLRASSLSLISRF